MLRWPLMVAGALVALTLLVALLGYTLPRAHVARSRAHFSQPVDSVWSAVRDMAAYPSWWSQLESAELQAGTEPETWIQKGPRVGTLPIIIEVDDPPRRLVTRIGGGLPFGGRWIYEVQAADGGSMLTVTEDGEIYNPIFRLVARFFMGYHGTMDSYLRDLGSRFGEVVVPEHVE